MITANTRARRWLRFFFWGAAALVTLYALFCAGINWAGAKAYESAAARVAAENETLDFKKLVPPPVSPAKNFFSIEPLRGIAIVIDHDTTKGVPAAKRSALESLKIQNKDSHPPQMGDLKRAQAVNVAEWTQWLRKAQTIPLPPSSGNDAADIRTAIETAYPLLRQFVDAARELPEAEQIPSLGETELPADLFSIPVPHLSAMMGPNRALQLHGLACAAAGQGDDALKDACVLLRFSAAGRREPLLISLLVATTQQAIAHEVIWHALLSRTTGDEALKTLQKELAPSWEEPTIRAFRGELAAAATSLQALSRPGGGGIAQVITYASFIRDGPSDSPSLTKLLSWLLPVGFIEMGNAHLIESELDMNVLPLKTGGLRALQMQAETQTQTLNELRAHPLRHPSSLLTRLMMPTLQGIVTKAIAIESLRRQAIIACALERYYLQHKAYPAALQALMPDFITEVPTDVMDLQPMRYRQTPDGRYALWAIGVDGKDDGGKVTLGGRDSTGTGNLSRSDYKGDWTWQYQLVK